MDSILKDNYKPTETLSMSDLLKADIDNQIQAQHLSKQCGKHLNRCSYSKGYLDQPVFACLTCNNHANKNSNKLDYDSLSGFCLGCSMNCHLDHNVIELWNKRNFRCDCGNKKFKSSKQNQCLLSCKKDEINDKNNYNHNFIGKYCYCNREYSVSQHTMHQCLNCQDWFHQTCIILNHLKANPHLKIKYDQQSNRKETGIETETNSDQKHDDTDDEQSPFFEYFRKILIPQSPDKENTFDSFICKDCAIKHDYFFIPYRWKPNTDEKSMEPSTTSTSKTSAPIPPSKVSGIKRNFSSMSEDSVKNDTKNIDNEPSMKRRKLGIDRDENEDLRMKRNISEMSTDSVNGNSDNSNSNTNTNNNSSNALLSNIEPIVCKRVLLNNEDRKNVLSLIGGGLWFEDNEWINKLCECNACKQEIYDKFGLKWLFEDEATNNNDQDENEDDDITKAKIYNLNNNSNVSEDLTPEFSTDAMTANTIQKLPRQQTLDALNLMMKGTDLIKQKFFEYVKKSNKSVVDADDIQNIFKNMT